MEEKKKPNRLDIELLEKEYFYLQGVIEGFDSKSLTIKAWSVSIAGVIAGSSGFLQDPIVVGFAAVVSLMFWFVEGYWKIFQNANYRRVNEIEQYMRGDIDTTSNLQILRSWSDAFHSKKRKKLVTVMFWPHVLFPHGAMFIVLVLVTTIWFMLKYDHLY